MTEHHVPFAPKSETEDWKLAKACTPDQFDIFFPDRGDDADIAKRICAGCTVRRECLTYALTPPREKFGIWGGTSNKDRKKLTLADIDGKPLPAIRYTAEARIEANAKRGRVAGRFASDAATATADRRAATKDAIAATVVEIGPRRKTGRILEEATA